MTSAFCHVAPFLAQSADTETESCVRQWRLKHLPDLCASLLLIPPRGAVLNRGADIKGCDSPLRVWDQRVEPGRSKTKRGGWQHGEMIWQSGQMKGEEQAREMKNGDRKKTNEWNAVPEKSRPQWMAAKEHQQCCLLFVFCCHAGWRR